MRATTPLKKFSSTSRTSPLIAPGRHARRAFLVREGRAKNGESRRRRTENVRGDPPPKSNRHRACQKSDERDAETRRHGDKATETERRGDAMRKLFLRVSASLSSLFW